MGIISKNIENLKPDKEYIVTVRAKNSDVNVLSDYTDSVRFRTPTDSTIPNAPAGLLLAASFLNVLFKYDDSIDPDHARYEYELYKQAQIQSVSGLYQIISGETPHRTGFVQTNVFTVSVDDNSYTTSTTSVTNPVKYYGRVRSIDSSNNISDWTSIVQSGDTPLIDEEFIGSLTAAKITAGTIGAHTIVLSGSTSIIQSANFDGTPVGDGSYSSATTGWLINGQGKAYFYDATVVGSIDIGGFDSGSFHVNTSGDMWLGAGTYGAAPFRVSRDGVLEIGAGTGSRIGGQLIDTIAETVIDFNGRNNRNSTNPTPPTLPSPVTVGNLVIGASYTIVSAGTTSFTSIGAANNTVGTVFTATGVGTGTGTVSGETIDHTLNTDGSANISFEWNYTYSSADNAANNIDGFYVHMYSSDSSSPYVIGTTPNLESTYPVDYLKRSIVFSGLPADKYYTFGVKAFRVVDKDIATSGILYSSIVQSSVTGENPYQPSTTVAFAGNITGTVDGTAVATLVSYANAGNTVATNFNTNNDNNGLTPTSPTLPSSIVATSIKAGSTYTILSVGTTSFTSIGAANNTVGTTFTANGVGSGTGTVSGETIDHVLNTDGSVDISFEWTYTNSDLYSDANNIDGFIVYVRSSTSASAYTIGTTPAEETTYYLPRERRAFILPGVAANRYYTLGVRAYRMVNSNVATQGIIYSSIVQSSVTGENPYQPSATVAFAGNITGTVNGTAVTTITTGINNFNNNNDRKSTTPATPTSVAFSTATSNTNASIDLPLSWTFTGSGDAYDVDGFIVFLRTTTVTNATSITTSDLNTISLDSNIQQVFLTAEKRSHTFSGISPSAFYRAAVRAYRVVDSDIDPAGVIYGPLLNTTQRTATIPTIGGSTGIKIGDGYIYIGVGNHGNLDTGFYVDSTGKFSLKDKLVWNGTTLTVKGTLQFSDGTTPGTFDNGDAITAGSIAGVTINSTKMYIGTGTFNNANTAFYVDNSGYFSLKNKLSWNGETLTVTGSITGSTITGSTLKTAATGDRVEINSNDIYLYNTATSTTSIKFDGTSVPAAFGVIQSLNAGVQIKGSGSTTYTVGAAAGVSEYQWDGSTGRMLTLSRVTGSTLLTVAGSINATAVTTTGNLNASQVQLSGASAGYYQYDRSNQALNWATYVAGGFYRIFRDGDRFALSQNDLYIYTLQVNAGGSSLRYIAGGQITSAASKKSLKNNIDYNISGLSIINKLKPASFTWKKTEMESEEVGKIKALHKNYGFIAEDVAEIDSAIAVLEPIINENMTQEEKVNSYRNIDSWIPSYYSETGILALAVKSIQELSERLEILENK